MKYSKFQIIGLLTLSLSMVSAPPALALEQLSPQRSEYLIRAILLNDWVAPYYAIAEHKLILQYSESENYQVQVDCEKRPFSHGDGGSDLAPGYCEITARATYGWANPEMILNVKGYIDEDKIHFGQIDQGKVGVRGPDLKITSVEIQTPLSIDTPLQKNPAQ